MSIFSGNGDSRRQTRRTLAVVVIVGLLLTACGGGGSKSASASSPLPSSSPSPSSGATSSASSSVQRTPEQLAADQKAAEAIVLKLSDFPAGWDSKPPNPAIASSPEENAATTQLGQCLHVDPTLVTDLPDSTKAQAQSDIFTDSQSLQANGDATVASSVEEVAPVFGALQQPEAAGCLKDFFSAGLSYALAHPDPGQQQPKDVTIGNIDVGQVNLPDVHGESVIYRLTIALNAGTTVNLVLDAEFAVKGRTDMTLEFTNYGDPFPQAMEVQLSNTVIDRAPSS